DQQKQSRGTRLQRTGRVLHELVVDADISQFAAESTRRRTDGRADQRREEYQADQSSPEGTRKSSRSGRIYHLIQLDLTVGRLDRNNGVAELDQVLPLHCQQSLANLLGLLFRRERDENEIAHGHSSIMNIVVRPDVRDLGLCPYDTLRRTRAEDRG